MKNPKSPNIHAPEFVGQLFAEMSATYNRVNSITSFGFSSRWRRQCAGGIKLEKGMTVVDLMTGMGEAWPYVLPRIGRSGSLLALDFCPAMLNFAEERRKKYPDFDINLFCEDALASSFADVSADAVISTFGLKTLSESQLALFAAEIHRILKPGGSFALIEISKPESLLLRWPYLFYLQKVIPVLGALFLGNPECYRMLGLYTVKFVNCRHVAPVFEKSGLEVEFRSYFGGCASGLVGRKP